MLNLFHYSEIPISMRTRLRRKLLRCYFQTEYHVKMPYVRASVVLKRSLETFTGNVQKGYLNLDIGVWALPLRHLQPVVLSCLFAYG